MFLRLIWNILHPPLRNWVNGEVQRLVVGHVQIEILVLNITVISDIPNAVALVKKVSRLEGGIVAKVHARTAYLQIASSTLMKHIITRRDFRCERHCDERTGKIDRNVKGVVSSSICFS